MKPASRDNQQQSYLANGYLFPLPALSTEEANAARRVVEAFETRQGSKISKKHRHKPHLLMPVLNDIIRSSKVLDAVENIIGPNILCWESVLFIKEPGDQAFVSWHQDATYWGLEPFEVVTAWIALSPSNKASGCMRVIPASHIGELTPHVDTFAPNNMLSRGQELAVSVDETHAVDIELAPGQMSLHDVKIVHGSEPNQSDDRRMGFAVRYIPTHVQQVAAQGDSAMLVRGVDRHQFFRSDPAPTQDFSAAAMAAHEEAYLNRMKIMMRQ